MGELHQIYDKNSGETVRIQSNIFHVFSDCYKQIKGKTSTLTEVDINSPV